jgi:hypothetical protein
MSKNIENLEGDISEDEIIEIKKPAKKRIYNKKAMQLPANELDVKPVEEILVDDDLLVDVPIVPETPKPKKKERTPAQIAAWEKCLANRAKAREERSKVKESDAKLLAEYKKQLAKKSEKKIVKKAIGIKKKAIMRDEDLDAISEEEVPIEVVKEKIKSSRRPRTNSNYIEPTEVKKPQLTFF